MRFNLKEADDVQIAFAAIVSAVMRVAELEQRVAALEHQTKGGEAVRALIYRHAPRRLSWRPARS
jgi:hypothetical protein